MRPRRLEASRGVLVGDRPRRTRQVRASPKAIAGSLARVAVLSRFQESPLAYQLRKYLVPSVPQDGLDRGIDYCFSRCRLWNCFGNATGQLQYSTVALGPDKSSSRNVARLADPHQRLRSDRALRWSAVLALPGVKLVLTHENCTVVWGAGSIAGGRQYVDEIKKTTRQKRYIFNNPVRFFGEPVAAVAATNRHIAEEALTLITVEYEARNSRIA